MVVGIGTDIIEIARFSRNSAPPGEHFLQRCFTVDERRYLSGRQPASMAGLFAAKEAAVKAIGTGFNGFWPSDVEILHDSLGKPAAVLYGKAAEAAARLGVTRIWISISHCGTLAVAMAVAEGTG